MWHQKQSLSVCIEFQEGAHLRSASTVRVLPLPPPLTLWLILDFVCLFVQKISTSWPLIFSVSTIREVIWPSPCTLLRMANWKSQSKTPPRRVLWLPIRDCTGSYNNLVTRGSKVSAIDMIANAIFERLYLVPGLRQFAPFVTMPSAPTPPPLTMRLFLDFLQSFCQVAPQFIFQHDLPSNLAESRYPPQGPEDGHIYCIYLFVLFCHLSKNLPFTACFTSPWTSVCVSMLILHVTSSFAYIC